MSVSIYVAARKRLIAQELDLINAYNIMVDNGIPIPEELDQKLFNLTGRKGGCWGERFPVEGEMVEILVRGEGRVMYEDGMIIRLGDMPAGTEELRIYALA